MNIIAGSVIAFLTIIFVSQPVNSQRKAKCCAEYCYDSDPERPQAAHFGSKTSYTVAKGPESGRQYAVPNCQPVKMWIISRHGTRLPEADTMERLKGLDALRDEIVENYEKRHSKPDIGFLCEPDMDLLKMWRWDKNITADFSEFLTKEGWNELKFLAIRLQRAFPNIMETTYDQQKFLFRYTNTQRTEASFKAFVEGLFGPRAHEYIRVDTPAINDTLLRAYDFCPAYDLARSRGDGTEYKKYLKSHIMKQVIDDVSTRLGFKYSLKAEQILDMYDMCRYDQAWHLENTSPWCAVFTPNQIDDIEYLEDLQKYYKSGYGNKMSSHIQCSVVNDMLNHLSTNDQPQAVTYFTHSKSMILFLTALQAAKDSEPLTADNYYNMQRRKWRLSDISPFASNFAAIKYDCPNEVEREKIMFFLNEKPLNFNWCKVGLCNLSDVKEHYKEFSRNDCDSYFCTSSASTNAESLFTSLLITSLIMIFFVA